MDFVGHLLSVLPQQFNGVLHGFEHLVSLLLSLANIHQRVHHLHQSVVVACRHILRETFLRVLNKRLEISQAEKAQLKYKTCNHERVYVRGKVWELKQLRTH